jgi:hypothetical protein
MTQRELFLSKRLRIRIPVGHSVSPFFLLCFSFFYNQMFFYTILNIFNTLLENVNKSRTSASSISLTYRHFVLHITQVPPPPLPWKARLRQGAASAFACNKKRVKETCLGMLPVVNIMRKYNVKTDLINDIIAGLTVGVMQLPQGEWIG